MILLDTNVVSEALRPEPSTKVISWLDEQVWETLYLSAITVAELRMGAAVLPDGRKKDLLVDRLENRIFPLFDRPQTGQSGCRCRRLYRGYGKIA